MRRYLVSVAELAALMGTTSRTVNRMATEGRFPFEPVTGMTHRHFRRVDVETYLGQPIDLDDLEVAS
jgi:excisionase family DNA binding protein